MRITGRNVLNEFSQRHPNARSALNRWYKLMRQENFDSFVELRRIFPHADQVKVDKNRFNPEDKILTVFNIGGNVSLITQNLEFGTVRKPYLPVYRVIFMDR